MLLGILILASLLARLAPLPPGPPPFRLSWQASGYYGGPGVTYTLEWEGHRGNCSLVCDTCYEVVLTRPASPDQARRVLADLQSLPLQQLAQYPDKRYPCPHQSSVSLVWSTPARVICSQSFDENANPYARALCDWRDQSDIGKLLGQMPSGHSLLDHP